MWWDIAPSLRAEFEDWHSREHFPERLALPGFNRASRWRSADGGEGFFVLYELARWETLSSPGYLARLNDPTPWSAKIMPQHRNMVRCQCRVLESRGGVVAQRAVTVAMSLPHDDGAWRASLRELIEALVARPGVVGAHLLRHEPPAIGTTAEERIRGGDRVADAILVVCGYDASVMDEVAATVLAAESLAARGVTAVQSCTRFVLSHAAMPEDVPA